jgi:hypothetical protein
VYKRGEMFVYFAQLIDSPNDKLYFVRCASGFVPEGAS